jgi:predicted small lipoprotein YifL
MRVTGIMLLFALLLQGCGHKGSLVLPQAQPATQQPNQGQ